MLSNATNQPKSTVELGYMCPRGLTGPPAVTLSKWLSALGDSKYLSNSLWLGVYWNCLSDKIFISYTNVDIIYYCI